MPSAVRRILLRRRDFLGVVGGAVVAFPAGAQARGELRIVLADETAQHAALVRSIRGRWPSVTTHRDASGADSSRAPPVAYLAVGPGALQVALGTQLDAPLVSALVSRQAYTRLVAAVSMPRGVTALYAEPSPDQQMRAIAAVFRRRVVVGALVSAQSRYIEPLLRSAAAAAGLQLLAEPHDPSIGLSRNLLRLAAADALVIFPDSSVYTPDSLRELLESTYRRRQPVFGFSEALVRAGTLASAYSDADDLAAHIVDLLGALSERRLPASQYPRYWRVAVNDNVARSLDIVVSDSARTLGDRP